MEFPLFENKIGKNGALRQRIEQSVKSVPFEIGNNDWGW
jgi:hypothetical protein